MASLASTANCCDGELKAQYVPVTSQCRAQLSYTIPWVREPDPTWRRPGSKQSESCGFNRYYPLTVPQMQSTFTDTMPEEARNRGTCQDMCPELERSARQRQKRLHRFEILEGTEQNRLPSADPARCVKEYSRPAAGKDIIPPAELRPPQVLLDTVDYLVNRILPRDDVRFAEVYNFVSDRLRAVRQDMVVQRVKGHTCVTILEKAVRFHVYAAYRLCESSVQQFDPHLNNQQLENCLTWLLREYKDDCIGSAQGNRACMEALYLMHCLGSHDALQHGLSLPKALRQCQVVQVALQLHLAQLRGDFVQVFRLVQQLPYIHSCAVHRHLAPERSHLQCLLGFDDETETAEFCRQHGLNAVDGYVAFRKADFSFPEKVKPKFSQCLVDDKLQECTLPDVIHGRADVLCDSNSLHQPPPTTDKNMDSHTHLTEQAKVEPLTGAIQTLSLTSEATSAVYSNVNTPQDSGQSRVEQILKENKLQTVAMEECRSQSDTLSTTCDSRSSTVSSGEVKDVKESVGRPWSRGRGRGGVWRGGRWRGRGRGRGRGGDWGV
ncbi:SAC3D1 [Branchiostoma lanceolatum]|uniref:SAC3D1 protein n=1 Tax=Branchiostoma lanceolatum TaxID=7740 RepID=A0A8J9ZD24_BRALA|nr:SAC3D1 [Branchiostoma lanceolatum]